MRNAPIVPGVPTPYKMHKHPYPTRFHGGNWTRPVWNQNSVIARPAQVFTQGYDIDHSVPQPTLSGLGAVNSTWHTGGGVFNEGGYGGGVFDGNISGLGTLTAPKRPALGILSDLFGGDTTDYPWKAFSEKTKALQQETNLRLVAKQRCPVVIDGKLGPGTCGAVKYVGATPPSTCQSFTDPAPLSANCAQPATTTPVVSTPVTQNPLLESGMSSSTKRALGFALGGALAIGAVMFLRKKK